jgi:hypothetical protein
MKQELTLIKKGVDYGSYDSIVIMKHISDIEGGRTLDMEGYPEDVLFAGHIIISKVNAESGEKTYLPMPVKVKTETVDGQTKEVVDEDGNKVYEYDTLPSGAAYEGVLYRSILKEKPAASIMFDGIVNDKVMKIQLGTAESGFKAACAHIIFKHDEEA